MANFILEREINVCVATQLTTLEHFYNLFNIYYLQQIITITYNTKTPAILFAAILAKNAARSETILVYTLINLAWLIKMF